MPSPLGRFTYTLGSSNKFWECLDDGQGTYLTRWGRIGTKGQSKPGLSSWQAADKIREKLSDGYVHDPASAPSLGEETRRRLAAAIPVATGLPATRRRM